MDKKTVVWLGRKSLLPPLATHWAVRVGDSDWYEVDGAGKKNTGERNTINGGEIGWRYIDFTQSKLGAKVTHAAGSTTKTPFEIERWNREFLRNHPTYDVLVENCQGYAHDLIRWLTDGMYDLPAMESSLSGWACGPNAAVTDDKQFSSARVTMGKLGIQSSIIGTELEGPTLGVNLYNGEGGYGALAEVKMIKFEVSVGPVALQLGGQFDTGISFRDSTFEIKFAGCGFHIGRAKAPTNLAAR